MNWFEDQLRNRLENDQEDFSAAFSELSSIVTGEAVQQGLMAERQKAHNAVHEILKYLGARLTPVPADVIEVTEYLDYCLKPSGAMKRKVELSGKWWKDAYGPILGFLADGSGAVALLPTPKGYAYFDYVSGKKILINTANAEAISSGAYSFYRPFPPRPLSILDLIKQVFSVITALDIAFYLLVLALNTIMGMLLPRITQYLYSFVIPLGREDVLAAITVMLVSMAVATQVMKLSQNIIMNRLTFKLLNTIEPAAMMRMLALKPEFFKAYAAGDLSEKFSLVTQLCTSIFTIVTGTLLTTLFSMAYFVQISNITAALLTPTLFIIGATLLFNIVSTVISMKFQKRRLIASAELSGMTYAMLSGITKIKMTGSEKRLFAKWAPKYKKTANYSYNPPFILKYTSVINTAITAAGLAIIYFVTLNSHIDVGDFMAFNVAYGMVSASVLSLVSLTKFFAEVKPMLDIIEPILSAEVENTGDKSFISALSGSVEINNLTFRYNANSRYILDGVNIKIRPGEYVALVGKTGSGKSTLVRLLLGFEKPASGSIYYDGKDISGIDLSSLRRRIGTVLQNSKLMSGDIFSNISISCPRLTLEEAWEAARIAGIDADIEDMPMGMHTVITEGSGSISGGQKQRLLIARAIAAKPKLMIFDESTSALDNITQKHVTESLAKLKSTRIVIAHRLSTIRECDKIYVLDEGKIIEEGSFDELYDKKGFFYELVSRQNV